MQTYAFFSDYVWLVNINSLFYPSFASFHNAQGGFQTSLVCIVKKPCLHHKQALFGSKRSLI